MFEPVGIIDPGVIIVRMEAFNPLLGQVIGYPALIFGVQVRAAHLFLKRRFFLMDPGINLHDERRDTFGNTHIRRVIAATMTVLESGFQRPAGTKPNDVLITTVVKSTKFYHLH